MRYRREGERETEIEWNDPAIKNKVIDGGIRKHEELNTNIVR